MIAARLSSPTAVDIAAHTAALDEYGPERIRACTPAEAVAWCRRLTVGRRENFSVLSALVPPSSVPDFSAVYAFCRVADDLGDESPSRDVAAQRLAWWRSELEACGRGDAGHPVFVALRPVIERHQLPLQPFHDLISAFELDQRVTRWDTWDDLLGYCRLSADPVGRLVLMLLGEAREGPAIDASDAICTALQLTNHWQDVRRDLLERDRIYLPRELWSADDFEPRLLATCRAGHAPDREFLECFRRSLREAVSRTWPLFERGHALLGMVRPAHRGLIGLFPAGGERVLRGVESIGFETCICRPTLSPVTKVALVARAWISTRFGRAA
jgi:squalene synthase HpnC